MKHKKTGSSFAEPDFVAELQISSYLQKPVIPQTEDFGGLAGLQMANKQLQNQLPVIK